MDNHPIPQDVTGFQFRLIGNMTVKQFGYVAIGSVGAVILYYLPIFFLIKLIFIPLFILGGVALAFIPVEGRPIDIMVMHFLKALFAPTQFIYHKEGGHLLLSSLPTVSTAVATQGAAIAAGTATAKPSHSLSNKEQERQAKLAAYLSQLHNQTTPDAGESAHLQQLFGTTQPVALPPVQPQAPVTPPALPAATPQVSPLQVLPPQPQVQTPEQKIAEDQARLVEDETVIAQVSTQLASAKQAETTTPTSEAHQIVVSLETRLQEALALKTALEQELASLRQAPQPAVSQAPAPLPVSAPEVMPAQPLPQVVTPVIQAPQPTVITSPAPQTVPVAVKQPLPTPLPPTRGVAKTEAARQGIPTVPEIPNILLGVVKDSSGNVLPHVLVEVRDTEGNPVRAFKTNQLGQFASATPLRDGVYTVLFEDNKGEHQFDPVTMTFNGTILPVLEVFSHDIREELRKSLFA